MIDRLHKLVAQVDPAWRHALSAYALVRVYLLALAILVLAVYPGASDPRPEAHAAITAEIAEQQKISAAIREALEATEAKLGIEAQSMVHDHSVRTPEVQGSPTMGDPVSRFRDYEETAERTASAEEENAKDLADFHRIVHPSREEIIRHALRRLEKIQVRTEKEEEELAFWRELLDKVVQEQRQ